MTSFPSEDAETATDEAKEALRSAGDAGSGVADTAKQAAENVAEETKQQAADLLQLVRDEVDSQAGKQQQNAADAIHTLSDELTSMAEGSAQKGPLTELARQGAHRGNGVAQWLESHEPRDVLHEVQAFARQRPVMFLALCGAAGVLAGRLGRGMASADRDDASNAHSTSDIEAVTHSE